MSLSALSAARESLRALSKVRSGSANSPLVIDAADEAVPQHAIEVVPKIAELCQLS